MYKFLLALLFCMAILFAAAIPARAQDDDLDVQDAGTGAGSGAGAGQDGASVTEEEEDEDEGEGIPFGPHPDIETTFLFPDFADKKFVLGEPVHVLVGFNNKGNNSFNITGIGAHLHSPVDLSYFIQNFTARRVVGGFVGPRQQGSVEYVFMPDPSLEPLPFWLSGWVLYNNSRDEVFFNTFVNTTIELVEPKVGFTVRSAFNYLIFFGAVGLVAYLVIQNQSSNDKSKSKGSSNQAQDVKIYKPRPDASAAKSPAKGKAKPKTKSS